MHSMPLVRRYCLVLLLVLGFGVCMAGSFSAATAAPLLQQGKKTLFQVLTGSKVHDVAGPLKPIPGTADIVDKLNQATQAFHQNEQVQAKLKSMGVIPVSGPASLVMETTARDTKAWGPTLDALNLSAK